MSDRSFIFRFFRPEGKLLGEGAWSGADPDGTVAALSKIVGFELFDEETQYLAGVSHPALANKWGASMRDAFMPFEAGLRKKYGDLHKWQGYEKEEKVDRNSLSFGSPNSNRLAQFIYDSVPDADGYFATTPEGAKRAISFVNASAARIKRTDRYNETHRGLLLADGRTFMPRHKDGVLKEDYLVISHVPVPAQVAADRDAENSVANLELRIDAINEKIVAGTASTAEINSLDALRDGRKEAEARIKTVLCVSGLYGPGTGAAGRIFSDPEMLEDLRNVISGRRFFHAIYHISKIRNKEVDGVWRDLPDRIEPIPVVIAAD